MANLTLAVRWCARDGKVTKVDALNPTSAMRVLNGKLLDQSSQKTKVEVARAAIGTPLVDVYVTGSARRRGALHLGAKIGAAAKGGTAEASASTGLSLGNAVIYSKLTVRADGKSSVTR